MACDVGPACGSHTVRVLAHTRYVRPRVQAAELAGEAWDRAQRAAHASEAVHEREGEGRAHALESDAGDLCMWAVGGGRWGGQQDGGCAPAQPAGHHLQQGAPASWLCCSHDHVLKVPRLIPFLLPLCG